MLSEKAICKKVCLLCFSWKRKTVHLVHFLQKESQEGLVTSNRNALWELGGRGQRQGQERDVSEHTFFID